MVATLENRPYDTIRGRPVTCTKDLGCPLPGARQPIESAGMHVSSPTLVGLPQNKAPIKGHDFVAQAHKVYSKFTE